MDIQTTKLELIQHLLEVKQEAVLNKIKEILLRETKEEFVAYTTSGESLNIEQYKAKIQSGMDDIKAGRVTSVENLEREIETW